MCILSVASDRLWSAGAFPFLEAQGDVTIERAVRWAESAQLSIVAVLESPANCWKAGNFLAQKEVVAVIPVG